MPFLCSKLCFAGVGQGICANHQADGPAYKDQGGHQLQHGQWAEVCRTCKNVQKTVSFTTKAYMRAQTVLASKGSQ